MPSKPSTALGDTPAPSYLSSAWPPFASRLADVLAALMEDQYLVISVKRSSRFVQFAGQGSFGMRAETTSNSYLSKSEQLDGKQLSAMAALGWLAPTGSPETATPENQPDGSPNFFRDYAAPVEYAAVAKLAVRTLAEVLRVPHPGFLEYEAFADTGRLEFDGLGLKLRAATLPAEDVESLQARLLTAVRKATGVADLEYDADGDIPVRLGTAISFTRLVEDPRMVRVYSPIVHDIEPSAALLARLNDINAGSNFIRLVHRSDKVFGVMDLMALPFVADHVIAAFQGFMAIVDGLDGLIKAEFGGETAFEDLLRSSQRH